MLRISHSNIRPTFQIAAFCILLGTFTIVEAQEPKSALMVEDVKALIPAIEAVERSLLNIKIESEAWVETKASLSDPCEPWKRTPIYVSSTAWLDGRMRSKAKVDVHKQVLEWEQGAAPFAESSYSVGFDGKYGRVANHTTGHSAKTYPVKEGRILSHAPRRMTTGWCKRFTGSRFSLHFFFNNDRDFSTLSQFLRKITSADVVKLNAFKFTWEKLQGVQCIKIDSAFDRHKARITYWLDPSHGFALLGHDNISIREDGSEQVSKRIRVTKVKEVASGIWWPMEASMVSKPYAPGKPYERFVYRASIVVANDPDFDETVFTVPFPPGYLIDDKVNGRKYTVRQQ